jgi:hypothetical protein
LPLFEPAKLPEAEVDEDYGERNNDDVGHQPTWGQEPPHRSGG